MLDFGVDKPRDLSCRDDDDNTVRTLEICSIEKPFKGEVTVPTKAKAWANGPQQPNGVYNGYVHGNSIREPQLPNWWCDPAY